MLTLADFTNTRLPTEQDVRDLINAKTGIITPIPRVLLLAKDNTPKMVIPDGRGGFTNDLTAMGWVTGCVTREVETDDVVGSCDLVLRGQAGDVLRTEQDRVYIYQEYQDHITGETIQRFPLGIYLVAVADDDEYTSRDTLSMKMGDESIVVTQLQCFADYMPPTGIKYTDVMATLLKMDSHSPDDGGRAPSGTAIIGPQSTTPPSYTMAGHLAKGLFPRNPATNYHEATIPGIGLIRYSPYDKAHCNDLGYPISPYNGQPMAASLFAPTWWHDVALDLFFKPSSGEFAYPFQVMSQAIVIDPYRNAPYPGGLIVRQPDDLHVGAPKGTITPPLATWPDDYDNSGPWWQSSTAQTVTYGGGPQPVVIGQPINSNFELARRSGVGTIVLVPIGTYWASVDDGGSADPQNPSQLWAKPPTSTQYNLAAFGSGWSWPGGTWTVTLSFTGGPFLQGAASITVKVYEQDPLGVRFLKGTLVGTAHNIATGVSAGVGALTASGNVIAFAGGTGNLVAFEVVLHVTQAITATLDTIGTAVLFGGLDAGFPAVALPPVTSYFDYGTNASNTTPSTSGSTYPYPDSNDPGLTPAHCPQEGPNIPAARVKIPDLPDTMPTQVGATIGDTFASYLAKLSSGLRSYKVRVDKFGNWTTKYLPYFHDGGIPEPVWTFTNEPQPRDGKIITEPGTRRLTDVNVVNGVLVMSADATSADVISSRKFNDSPDSTVSRVNMGRPVTKVIVDSAIGTQEAADRRADLELQSGGEGTNSFDFVTYANPALSVGDPINIIWRRSDGALRISGDGDPFFITSIETSLMESGAVTGVSKITVTRTGVI